MRILAVADYLDPLRCALPRAPAEAPVELVLSCGDLAPEYLVELARCFQAPLLYVRGNHDLRRPASSYPGCTDLHGRLLQVGGLRVAGLEGSHWYSGGPRQYTERQMRRLAFGLQRSIRRAGGVDVLIAHAPPGGLHDGEDPCHRGFAAFRRLIERWQPGCFIHGHLHRHFDSAAERFTQLGRTRVVNCAGCVFIEA